MINLDLKTTCHEQEKIKAYLENNVSAILADKINNGVKIEKDGKMLINKKDLVTFMAYAEEQVLEMIAENERKGRQMRCIDDPTVYGWAIHYFEEDSIEGKLYNEDGTEYQPPKPVVKTSNVAKSNVTYTPPKPQLKPQMNIFDMLASAEPEAPTTPIVKEQPNPEPKKGSAMYQHYLSVKQKYNDCIVFYRLGDFYEMFGDDAKKAADVLNLTLTGRDCGLDERVPMTGVPFHAVDNYITKLISAGYKVAVCELLDGNNERTVERVVTRQPETNQLVDIGTGEILKDSGEELSVEEMRQFDGDIEEPEEVPTVSKLIGTMEDDDDFDYEKERQAAKAFDVEAMLILQELFGDKMTIV